MFVKILNSLKTKHVHYMQQNLKFIKRLVHQKVPVVLVHGGAGDITNDAINSKRLGVVFSASYGYSVLMETGSVLEAVQEAVKVMESDTNFNAGFGSVLTCDGTIEMDAAIMNGSDLNCGAVSGIKNIKHPIFLARSVMEETKHKYLTAEGAMNFAKCMGFEILPDGALVTKQAMLDLQAFKKTLTSKNSSPGTVGAVAIDCDGNVAAATSTGGLIGKMPGRVGDSAILGGGTYADNASGAVSATGHGETIMRYNVVSRILAHIQFANMNAQEATAKVLKDMTARFRDQAGAICLDKHGNIGIHFTADRMAWAYRRLNELHCGVCRGEDNVTVLDQ